MAKLLSILLQKSDPAYPWGFTVQGGLQDHAPLTIHQVTPGSLAAQYLAPGDSILQIEKIDTRTLHHSQVEALVTQPRRSLDLLVMKGDSPDTFPRTPTSPGPRPAYSSDSGSASGGSTGCGRDLRQRKQNFWERVSNDDRDFSKEGFTRLESGTNSPFKQRPSFGNWRRCQSEEKSAPRYEDSYTSCTDSSQRSRKKLDPRSNLNRIHSVWSPNPERSRTPTFDSWPRDDRLSSNEERQGNITFWEYDTSEGQNTDAKSSTSGSLNRSYRRHHSDFSHGYSSMSSEYATTPKSELDSERDSPFEYDPDFMKKPSDIWGDRYKDERNRIRLGSVNSPTSSLDSVWKNSNVVSKTQFKKSTSVKQTSYSSTEGSKSTETFEHLNKIKETEKSSKIVDGGKEEMIEKIKQNKEHIIANKDDINGQPIETTKVINDFKTIEKVFDGKHEFCNKVKEHNEEVINSNTPVNFYDNVQQHGVVETPTVQTAEWCDHTVNRQREVGHVRSDETFIVDEEDDARSPNFSPIVGRDMGRKRWASSTPLSEGERFNEGFIYQQEEPLMENYFEVDIRSPIEMEVVFPLGEEPIRRQSSQISGGGSPIPVSPQGDNQVPPPPPPPPPPSGHPAPPPPPPPGLQGNIPAVRLSSEIPEKRRSAYEPPAAIQNAMMTKDKKPFTYTPGGLDLSEIRSPRMARRINRNANTPDNVPPPPQSRPTSVPSGPLPPSAVAAMQPQIAIPVLPQGGGMPHLHHVVAPPPPPPPPQNMSSPPPPPQPVSPQRVINRQPSPPPMAVPKLQPQHRHTKSEPQASTPGSIYVPPIEPQQPRSQLGSLYIPPIAPQESVTPQSPVSQLNKAPTPWMSRQNQQSPKEVPSWVNREAVQSPPTIQNQQQPQTRTIPIQSPSPSQNQQQNQTRIIPIQIEGKEPAKPNERIIPIQIEGTPSPQPPQAPYYNQPPSYQQQQQQYQPQQQQYQQPQQQYQPHQQYQQPQQQYQSPQQYQPPQQQYQQQQYQQPNSGRQTPQTPRWANQQPVYTHNKFNTGSQSPVTVEQNNGSSQPSWRHSQTNGSQSPGPVQSQSFKVLQKITGTDGADQNDSPYNSQGVPLSQLRKLQLSEDDRALMDKVKSQVDDETYLHNESDPRYRGSAIPSRAFRILQNMTDGAGAGDSSDVPQAYSPVQGGQSRLAANRTPQPDAPQQYVPPSEQQAAEPRKYTGGAIPSRSFRMLQAMTAGSDPSAAMSDGRQTPQIYEGEEVMWAPNNYPYPPNYYYYPPPPPPPPPPPQSAEQQQQFWDHYNAMCSYVAEMNNGYGYPPYGYSPHLYTPPPSQSLQYTSDSDECGYSSTDEMNYYAAYFKKYPPPIQPYRTYYHENRAQTPQIVITPSRSYGNSGYCSDLVSDSEKESNRNKNLSTSSPSVNGDSGETTTDDGSDTEVEEDNSDRPMGLQTIKSVPDISVYKDSSTSDIQSQNSETDEPDEETNEEEEEEEYEDELPHQLSVIFEESEHSDLESLKKMKCSNGDGDTNSEGESSTATIDNGDDTDDDIVDAESSTVLVRLPLKLKFSKTENNEDLTTVIVGDSEIESSPEAEIQPGGLIIQEVKRVDDEPDVSVTFTIPKKKTKPPEMICGPSELENNNNEFDVVKHKESDGNYELNSKNSFTDNIEDICDKEVVVDCDDICQTDTTEDRCKSESPIDFWKELSCDDVPTKLQVPVDVSISIMLPPKDVTKSGSRSPFNIFTSESDDSRPEESDGHWEDDSSSTSVQTVRIGKHSGSDNFSGSEVDNCGTADEVEDIQKVSSPFEVERMCENEKHIGQELKNMEDDHEKIPIEDLLYDTSSSDDDDDDESTTSSSSSESSGESSAVSEQSKGAIQTSVTSNESSRAEEKGDDDVFVSESSKSEVSNRLTVEQKPRKVRGIRCKSQDESEEDDSGVTSDMSRHISETDTEPECGSELRKLTPYQRASTHSRLFKLLQDECSTESDELISVDDRTSADTESISSRKERLSLPLQTYTPSDPDSMSSSSGINSPVSPTVNDRLVRELVQSLLTKKKGRHLRKLPMEKLYAAALRILQEDMDPYDTLSSTSDDSFQHSPISDSTAIQTNDNTATNPASQTQEAYGGNYYDYSDYYNTWRNPYYYSDVEDSLGYDIIPSRAFKLLQERAQTPHGFSSGVIEGLVAKCPRVLSSKDVPKDFGEVPVPESCPQTSSSSET